MGSRYPKWATTPWHLAAAGKILGLRGALVSFSSGGDVFVTGDPDGVLMPVVTGIRQTLTSFLVSRTVPVASWTYAPSVYMPTARIMPTMATLFPGRHEGVLVYALVSWCIDRLAQDMNPVSRHLASLSQGNTACMPQRSPSVDTGVEPEVYSFQPLEPSTPTRCQGLALEEVANVQQEGRWLAKNLPLDLQHVFLTVYLGQDPYLPAESRLDAALQQLLPSKRLFVG